MSKIIKSDKNEEGAQRIRQLTLTVWLGLGISLLLLWFGVLSNPPEVVAQEGINWPRISLTRQAGGLSQPVHITHAGDGSGRLFVVEQKGRIRVIKNGVLLNTPFLDITKRVRCCGERGLLSVAFPPDYASKGYFYVYYTNAAANIVVARYFLTSNPDVGNPNNEQIVLTINHPKFANHNGGQLAFGPNDGYLYIGTGDGGGGGDLNNNAQNPNSLLGKLLRIDVESGTIPYAIPPSNPYRQTSGYRGETWALGLRNPWRFSFDRQTADLYIADVGQNSYEEIDFQPASSTGGENYGWRCKEGAHDFNMSGNCSILALKLPVYEYDHSQGCSITGGMVYRRQTYPRMQGIYFYGDYCSGRIWGLKRNGTVWQNTLLLNALFHISSFGEDEAGNLYVTDYSNGGIYMITDTSQNSTLTFPSPSPTTPTSDGGK